MNEKKTFETVKNVLLNKDISEEEVVDIVREKIPNDIRFRTYKGIEKFMKQYMWNNNFAASYIQNLMSKRLSANGITKRYENESNTDIANEQREFARKYGEMDEESPICTVIQINQPADSPISIILEIEKYAKEHIVNLPQAAHHFFRDCKSDTAAYNKFYKLKRKENGKKISNELFKNVLEFLKDPSIDLKEIADLLADELDIDKTFSANNESETLSFIINKIYNKLKPGQLVEVENARNQKIKDSPVASSTDDPKDNYVEENKRLRADLKNALIENMCLKDKLSSTESELERMKQIICKSRNIYNEICDAYSI